MGHMGQGGVCNPWWQVDLGKVEEIENVVIFGRTDAYAARLRNFRVEILEKTKKDGSNWETNAELFFKGNASPITLATFPKKTMGQMVRVRFSHCEPLSLSEVEVY